MDYSVHYVPRNDGETDAALVVRRGAHELSFTEAAAWTAIKGWLAPMGEAAEDVPFGCVAQYTLPSVVLDADAYSTSFVECFPTDAGFSRWPQPTVMTQTTMMIMKTKNVMRLIMMK